MSKSLPLQLSQQANGMVQTTYLALKISKSGSPLKAIPSKRPIPLVIKAKNGGTLKGYLKNKSFNSLLMLISFRFLACKLDPDSNRPFVSTLDRIGCNSDTSMSLGRKPRSLASFLMRESKSPAIGKGPSNNSYIQCSTYNGNVQVLFPSMHPYCNIIIYTYTYTYLVTNGR